MIHLDLPFLNQDAGLLLMRVAIGLIFAKHGYEKLVAGESVWLWVGQQMALVGIPFFPSFWGLLATITEFAGGICLALGLCTRWVSLLLAAVMVVAVVYHIHSKDDFTKISHPLSLLFVFLGFVLAGAGSYSLDAYLKR